MSEPRGDRNSGSGNDDVRDRIYELAADELERRADRLAAEAQRARAAAAELRAYLAESRRPVEPMPNVDAMLRAAMVRDAPSTALAPASIKHLYHAIHALLVAAGRPVAVVEIETQLREAGWDIGGVPSDTLRVTMQRRPHLFRHVGRALWEAA